jgi:hypothetical protein
VCPKTQSFHQSVLVHESLGSASSNIDFEVINKCHVAGEFVIMEYVNKE